METLAEVHPLSEKEIEHVVQNQLQPRLGRGFMFLRFDRRGYEAAEKKNWKEPPDG
jgi:hypothetical protein